MKPAKASTPSDFIAAVEREKRQIGFELHDNICQTLAGTSMLIEMIGRAVTAGEPVSSKDFRKLGRILETAIDQTRSLSQYYRPANLEGAGLMKGLHDLSEANGDCTFHCEKPVFMHSNDHALALYRIAQEAVKNAAQHSPGSKISISLDRVGTKIVLKVQDNGPGFTRSSTKDVSGITVMHMRAAAAEGALRISSKKGVGTTVRFTLFADKADLK